MCPRGLHLCSPEMEHFFSPISSTDPRSDAHQSQIIGGDANEDRTQIIGGYTVKLLGGIYPPIPPGFRHPWFELLHYSVVMKPELSKKAKLLIFKTVFVPILTYGQESLVMTEIVRSQVQACEWVFCVHKVRSSEIRKTLNIEPLLLRNERSQLGWVRPCNQNAWGNTSQTSFTCQSKWEKTNWTT